MYKLNKRIKVREIKEVTIFEERSWLTMNITLNIDNVMFLNTLWNILLNSYLFSTESNVIIIAIDIIVAIR